MEEKGSSSSSLKRLVESDVRIEITTKKLDFPLEFI